MWSWWHPLDTAQCDSSAWNIQEQKGVSAKSFQGCGSTSGVWPLLYRASLISFSTPDLPPQSFALLRRSETLSMVHSQNNILSGMSFTVRGCSTPRRGGMKVSAPLHEFTRRGESFYWNPRTPSCCDHSWRRSWFHSPKGRQSTTSICVSSLIFVSVCVSENSPRTDEKLVKNWLSLVPLSNCFVFPLMAQKQYKPQRDAHERRREIFCAALRAKVEWGGWTTPTGHVPSLLDDKKSPLGQPRVIRTKTVMMQRD